VVSADSLIGFARVRFPPAAFSSELEGAALVRELHVYGSLVPLGKSADDDEFQHRSYGKVLLSFAEEISREGGYHRLAIMSGIGVRPYYRRQGFERTGPYMTKELG
jgi:elongator complex protein 3